MTAGTIVTRLLLSAMLLLLVAVPGNSQSEVDHSDFDPVWATAMEIVREVQSHHPIPPTLQEMVAHGAGALELDLGPSGFPTLVKQVSAAQPSELKDICGQSWSEALERGADSEELTRRFMTGILSAVPGATRWIPPAEARVSRQLQENRYVGIGISVKWNNDATELIDVFYGGPAWTAKLQPGDRVVEIDGESAIGIGLVEAINRLRGPLGTELSIKVDRGGELLQVDMKRLEVPIATVLGVERQSVDRWNVVFDQENRLGYVRIQRIAGSTPAEIRCLIRQSLEQDCRGLVLDFRGAAGGGFHQTLLVADALIGGDEIGRRMINGKVEPVRSSTPAAWPDRPIVVLGGGGGSAEIVWMIDALRQRSDVKVIGWPVPIDGYLTQNYELKTGGLLENLPEGFLLLHPRNAVPHDSPAVASQPLLPQNTSRIGQIALLPDVRGEPDSRSQAGFDPDDPEIKVAVKLLLELLD